MAICSFCLEETDPHTIDQGIGYSEFGSSASIHTDIVEVSTCCDSPIFEGHIYSDEKSEPTANKNHYNKDGNLIVAKGQKYECRRIMGYYIDSEGERQQISKVYKKPIS